MASKCPPCGPFTGDHAGRLAPETRHLCCCLPGLLRAFLIAKEFALLLLPLVYAPLLGNRACMHGTLVLVALVMEAVNAIHDHPLRCGMQPVSIKTGGPVTTCTKQRLPPTT
jgi:hypothetical protein